MNTREFVEIVREAAAHLVRTRPPLFVGCGEGGKGSWAWTFPAANSYSCVKRWLSEPVYLAVVYPDDPAQLLSRDEDECLLFQTLWELER